MNDAMPNRLQRPTRAWVPTLRAMLLAAPMLLAATALPRAAIAQETLAEIVVTAQKRAQNLQEVPVAVDAFSAATLGDAGAVQPVDLATMTPNLTAKNAVGNTAPIFALRGIGLNDFATNGTQPVGAYVDEVYMVNNSQLGFQLMDLERVEVLKGPQGTLYGRNTTAGAINFISSKPTRKFEAGASLTVGNYGLTGVESYVNGALGDHLSGRFSVAGERQFRGYFTNDTDGSNWGRSKRLGWRGQLLWELGRTSVLVNLHGGVDKSDDWYYKYVDDALGSGAYFKAAVGTNADIFHGLHTFEPQPYIDNLSNGLTVSVDHDYGAATLRSITSFESLEYARSEDYGSGPLPNGWNNYAGHLTTYSEELRLTSNGQGPWGWIVGAFGGHDRLHENDRYNELYNPAFPGYIFDERYLQNTSSLALFAHNEIALSERLRLTAGIRYTDETKRYTGGTYPTFTTTAPAGLPPIPATAFDFAACPCLADTQLKYHEPTGKLGLDYRFERVMLYLSGSRGYKAGGITGFYVTDPGGKAPYKPEFINAYEAGFKATTPDGRLRVNGALFYYDYKDLQAFGPEPINPANPTLLEFRIFNVAKSRVQGAELELSWLPLDGLKIDLGAGLLDTKVLESAVIGVGVGNRLGNAPNAELDSAISYKWSLSPGLTATAGVDANWRGGTYYYVQKDPRQFEPAYFLWNPRFMIAGPGEVWSVKFWMKNASDKHYFREIFNDGGSVIGFPAAPRTYGATFSYRWQ